MTDEQIQVSQDGAVLTIAINRPERKNALTHDMYRAITAALLRAEEEAGIKVVLITGTEDCFTAGNDMGDFLNTPPEGEETPVMRLLALLPKLETPLVAAVNGPAVGIGTTLLLHCDLVYLAPGARLQMPFVNLGLCPEAGSSMLLPLLIGHQRAAQLLLLGETFDAERALELGLANEVCENGYRGHALEKAKQLAAQPAAAVRLSKRLMKQSWLPMLEAIMAEEGEQFGKRLTSPEAREAMQAFMEKRKPDFTQFDRFAGHGTDLKDR
jgi:enoyl-CoA hydratase/carnithine racemase